MNIEDVRILVTEIFQNDMSDLNIIEGRFIYFVCYGTIPAECWLSRGQLEIKYGTFGVLNSGAGYLKSIKNNSEAYLYKYAKFQLLAFKDLCLSVLPDKYLKFYKSGFQLNDIRRISLDFESGVENILRDAFVSTISNINTDGSTVNFIIHESICFSIQIEKHILMLTRQLIYGYSIVLLKLDFNKAAMEYMIEFIRAYSDSILPDEWLLAFPNI